MSSPKPTSAPRQLPNRLGRYHILGHLASGGMAEVLLAKLIGPSGFERPVIIKRILPNLATRPEFVTMFLDEARIIAAIRHPNVVQVQELVHDHEELYLVMEYLAGENIAGIITRLRALDDRLDYALCAHIVSEACAGLHATHELTGGDGEPLNIVHRDISPQNIFVTYDGTTKVLDFGIAKAADRFTTTEAGQLKGKFAYMSPEQCKGLEVDRRTDIFALGVVLYELTTGHRLFARPTAMKTLEAICYDIIPAPSTYADDYPAELERICLKALDRDPAKRYATAADMRRDLVEVTQSLGFQGIPEEVLAIQMADCFVDRISEKKEMLSRVRSGSILSHIPSPEVTSEMSLAVRKPGDLSSDLGASGVHTVDDSASLRRGGGRRWLWGTLLAAALLTMLAFILPDVLRHPQQEPHSSSADGLAPALGSTQRSQAHSDVPRETPSSPTRIPVPHTVAVTVDSKPQGAEVSLNGRSYGTTPLTASIEQGEVPITLRLALKGYTHVTKELIPSGDQQLYFVMPPQAPRKTSTKPAHRAPPPPPPRPADDFHRFD
ncbi:MAG: serine/threonine protein kinase [Myxococcales bacterium]|nr:serine/threonine protein kinase [Myxococcales bacterium]MCB9709279.1 serine/threonine protein kinase [Myxococcales bacterium]